MDKKSKGRGQSDMSLTQIAYQERKKTNDVVDEALASNKGNVGSKAF